MIIKEKQNETKILTDNKGYFDDKINENTLRFIKITPLTDNYSGNAIVITPDTNIKKYANGTISINYPGIPEEEGILVKIKFPTSDSNFDGDKNITNHSFTGGESKNIEKTTRNLEPEIDQNESKIDSGDLDEVGDNDNFLNSNITTFSTPKTANRNNENFDPLKTTQVPYNNSNSSTIKSGNIGNTTTDTFSKHVYMKQPLNLKIKTQENSLDADKELLEQKEAINPSLPINITTSFLENQNDTNIKKKPTPIESNEKVTTIGVNGFKSEEFNNTIESTEIPMRNDLYGNNITNSTENLDHGEQNTSLVEKKKLQLSPEFDENWEDYFSEETQEDLVLSYDQLDEGETKNTFNSSPTIPGWIEPTYNLTATLNKTNISTFELDDKKGTNPLIKDYTRLTGEDWIMYMGIACLTGIFVGCIASFLLFCCKKMRKIKKKYSKVDTNIN